ncbi:MAG: hypothetical protein ACXQT3_05105 [Methermicoccaceae archaeon]
MLLGSIVAVEGLDGYVVAASGDERASVGSFVRVASTQEIVGIIVGYTNTIREELIPYMHPKMQERYLPYNIDFERTHYDVLGVGTSAEKSITIPPRIGDEVYLLTDEQVQQFHSAHGAYYLSQKKDAIDREVALLVVEKLQKAMPEQQRMLELAKRYIRGW